MRPGSAGPGILHMVSQAHAVVEQEREHEVVAWVEVLIFDQSVCVDPSMNVAWDLACSSFCALIPPPPLWEPAGCYEHVY